MVLDDVGARLSGGMLTETLKVDPSALHVTAARLQEDVAGLARSSPASALSAAAGSMPGCATAVACSRLQGVVDTKVNALSADMSQFADRLRTVGDFNRKVHMEHYNRIIPEVARKVLAEVPGRSLAAL